MLGSNRIENGSCAIIAGLLALLLAFCGCVSKIEKRDGFLHKGIRLYEAGDYEKAVLEFKNAIQLDHDFATAYFFLGKAYLGQEKTGKALACLSKALELDEGLDEARVISGMILVTDKEGEKALERIAPVLEKDPAHARALLIAAQAFLLLEQPDKAIASLKKTGPAGGNREVLFAFAEAYRLKGEMRLVKEYLSLYQKTAPDDPVSYELLSGIYLEEGQLRKAEAEIRKLIEQKKGDPSYPISLCRFFAETGQDKRARSEFERLIEEDLEENRYKLAYAEFLIRQKRFDQAQAVLTAGVRNAPNSWKARDLLVGVCLAQGKRDDALRELDDFLQRNVREGRIHALLKKGEILLQLDRPTEAMKQCNLALAMETTNLHAHLLKGKVLLQKGEFSEAIIHLRQVVDRSPSELEGRIFLARALSASGYTSLAIEDLKRGLKDLPGSIGLRMELIVCYEREKEWKSALEEANAGLAQSPEDLFFLIKKGRMLTALKDFDEAGKIFQAIIRSQPRQSIGCFELGRLKMAAGDRGGAKALFDKGVRLKQDKAKELGLEQEYKKEYLRLLNS